MRQVDWCRDHIGCDIHQECECSCKACVDSVIDSRIIEKALMAWRRNPVSPECKYYLEYLLYAEQKGM
jgi:hypothetical protein